MLSVLLVTSKRKYSKCGRELHRVSKGQTLKQSWDASQHHRVSAAGHGAIPVKSDFLKIWTTLCRGFHQRALKQGGPGSFRLRTTLKPQDWWGNRGDMQHHQDMTRHTNTKTGKLHAWGFSDSGRQAEFYLGFKDRCGNTSKCPSKSPL